MAALCIAKGAHGVNKLWILRSPNPSFCTERTLVFFAGDRVEAFGMDEEIHQLQDPAHICAILAAKAGPATTVVAVIPSHYEACCAVYHHFFEKLTLTGEPLGYSGRAYKASEQLHSLLEAAGVAGAAAVDVVGFSKGGIVLNQVGLCEIVHFKTFGADSGALPTAAARRGGGVCGGAAGGAAPRLRPTSPLPEGVPLPRRRPQLPGGLLDGPGGGGAARGVGCRDARRSHRPARHATAVG